MRQAVLQKFKTYSDICQVLPSTGDELIVENAPGDYSWVVVLMVAAKIYWVKF